jgi:hypothetical protein
MGLVIDKNIAFKECHGYSLDSQKLLWSAGVIGMLSDEQEKLCEKIHIKGEVPRELQSRYLFFKTSADKCSREVENLPRGERLVKFLECMSREAKEKGIEI